jgi:hypothetical protein
VYVMSEPAPMSGVLDWWSWWSPPRSWYTMEVRDPYSGRRSYLAARKLTAHEAREWRLDTVEANWGADVTPYRWNGTAWQVA